MRDEWNCVVSVHHIHPSYSPPLPTSLSPRLSSHLSQRDLLSPNTRPMVVPKKVNRKRSSSITGRGFGVNAPTSGEVSTLLRLDTLKSEGVCYVPNVLSKTAASDLLECVRGELRRAYEAVEEDPERSVARFNVPADIMDPLRGYMLMPLRDEAAVEAGDNSGAMIRALRECLTAGTVLGDLFGSDLCGGGDAEFYDLTALRTEAGATRQPIHFDTPFQEVPGLFCAFIAMEDVEVRRRAELQVSHWTRRPIRHE